MLSARSSAEAAPTKASDDATTSASASVRPIAVRESPLATTTVTLPEPSPSKSPVPLPVSDRMPRKAPTAITASMTNATSTASGPELRRRRVLGSS